MANNNQNASYWYTEIDDQGEEKKQRSKTFEHDGVAVNVSFRCSEVTYAVKYEDTVAHSRDFQQAVATAGVPPKKVNHLVRGLKMLLGL